MPRILSCLLLLLSTCAAQAQAQAQDWKTLANDREWQALLHVNRGATAHDRGESYVDDDKFFLASNGKENPQAELEADAAAMQPAASPQRCRFPARYFFLADRLGWKEDAPLAHCSEYLEWRSQIPSARAVLVFPASYLNSPSSMFGHTLLRLDASQAPDNVWNSWAVNFGALTMGKDNSILYIWRGLAGGYPGHFSIVPYVSKIQEYSNLENRDIWEYSLKLDEAEMTRMINHLWELRDINFDYYFFDENCSFRLLELLEVAKPQTAIIEGFRFTEEPVNTVRTLYAKDLVSDRVYRPSKAMELQADAEALSWSERRLAKRLLQDPMVAKSSEFMSYPPQRRHLMARTAWRTLRFKERKNERTAEVAKKGMELLQVMQANPPEAVTVPQPSAPEKGHGTQMITVGGGQRDAAGFGEIGYRLTYHDLIDNPQGFLKGAQIEGLDLRLRHSEDDSLSLESLDLINIRSLSPRNAFVKPLSWFVQAGLEQAQVYEDRDLVGFVQGGAGLSWRWQGLQPYVLASARIEHADGYKPFIELGGGGSAGLLWYSDAVQLNAGAEGVYFANGEYRWRTQAGLNIPLGQENGLRLQWQQDYWRDDKEREFSLAWRHYFD